MPSTDTFVIEKQEVAPLLEAVECWQARLKGKRMFATKGEEPFGQLSREIEHLEVVKGKLKAARQRMAKNGSARASDKET